MAPRYSLRTKKNEPTGIFEFTKLSGEIRNAIYRLVVESPDIIMSLLAPKSRSKTGEDQR